MSHVEHSRSYRFVHLGCPKNLVDAERAAGGLDAAGWREAPDEASADLVIVTTCAFIEPAVEESVDEILRVAAARRPEQRIAVVGCLVSREGERLPPLLPEVDLFLDVAGFERLAAEAAAIFDLSPPRAGGEGERRLFTPPHIGYLKIAEGCSNRCSYCLIPSIRGDLVCRGRGEIVREAAWLASRGVREVVVIAQDTTAWRDGDAELVDLLEEVATAAPDVWLRLMYLHPRHLDVEGLVRLIESGAILPYLDIPVQHAADGVLRRMRRGYGRSDLERIFGRLREVEGLTLRTTAMTGFPGETDEDFRELADFLERTAFDHVGVFVFSPEEGTSARGKAVPRARALARRDELLELQMEISHERLTRLEDARVEVLVDGKCAPEDRPEPSIGAVGRFAGQAWEIDGVCWLSGEPPPAGRIVEARVARAEAYDLFVEPAGDFR